MFWLNIAAAVAALVVAVEQSSFLGTAAATTLPLASSRQPTQASERTAIRRQLAEIFCAWEPASAASVGGAADVLHPSEGPRRHHGTEAQKAAANSLPCQSLAGFPPPSPI